MARHSWQAITTKHLGPTNFKGSRIKATAEAGSITISYDDSLNTQDAHAKAAEALARKFGWTGEYYQGGTANGYCFVCVDNEEPPAFDIPTIIGKV